MLTQTLRCGSLHRRTAWDDQSEDFTGHQCDFTGHEDTAIEPGM